MIYRLLRPLLFRLEPEAAHQLTLRLIALAGQIPPARWALTALFAAPARPVNAFGLQFKNPVGLAAGYDKDGLAVRGLAALGFGHLEIGTVTPRPQPGNLRPRVFRLPQDEAVINRMGFPGQGMEIVAGNLRRAPGVPLGINLGKNKDTPLEAAAEDYLALMRRFSGQADYFAINISSPNTVGLRRLQGRAMLENLLAAVARARRELPPAPILVKLAPDLSDEELDDALAAIVANGMDGVIATNTTLRREGLTSPLKIESGGLSGRPLTALADATLEKIVARLAGRLPVVAVGGILTPADARRKLELGATLVQIYTGLVYAGPRLVQKIIREIPAPGK
ncbi:MAG: dihydroorotate dehydrogenase (quinone) [Anaerolineae bacterium CG_4_9_14_3_um_filter_57_17]|nr:quinone-dependent dihydroorotate dehydrogenase [bacterium]NCT19971.1 quinone-dependent dihydroorotate dehydrogenase [bacterium]OIO84025.1 MAG: dihydroorotate dehydrogenase (quinone) [Anaerolineae bacterium CG2_30_57_67]PJB68277.1 MAG: dihydroorotate dehydrogenase (quinone) [Anaerolineae bacterium CG_4_9_14_3_um_filter_57_17]